MKTKYLPVVLVFTLVMCIPGCATIITGKKQPVMIDSEPQGAAVVVAIQKKGKKNAGKLFDEREMGVTPITVEVKRKNGVVIVSKEGYKTQEVSLLKKMNRWMWLDIGLGSPLSTSIDTSTGAAKQYKPGEYLVTLETDDE